MVINDLGDALHLSLAPRPIIVRNSHFRLQQEIYPQILADYSILTVFHFFNQWGLSNPCSTFLYPLFANISTDDDSMAFSVPTL